MNVEHDVALSPAPLPGTRRPYAYSLFGCLLLLLLAACTQPTPTPFPEATQVPEVTLTPVPSATALPLTTYQNDIAAFSVALPETWAVEKRGLTPLGEYYQIGPVPVGPGPASSALFVTPIETLTAAGAAEMLLCGGGCAEDVNLEETTIAGQPALHALLDAGEATLEWFFLEHRDHLIFFTLHDPETLATRADLLASFALLEPAPTATPTSIPPTPTPEPTATSPATTWDTWQSTAIADAAVIFERPDGWLPEQIGPRREWMPVAGSEVRLGFAWRPLAPDQDLRLLLPGTAEIVASAPFTLTWEGALSEAFTRGERVTVQNAGRWEEHALFQVGLRAYDLYIRGPANGSLEVLQPVLEHALASLRVEEARLSFEDPVEAAVAWFRALVADPSGEVARSYMTPALRAQVPSGTSPLTLLSLEQPLAIFDLTWLSGNQQEAVIEAALTLADDSVVRRQLTLGRDPAAGWQVNGIVTVEGP